MSGAIVSKENAQDMTWTNHPKLAVSPQGHFDGSNGGEIR